MQKHILTFFISLVLFSCSKESRKNETSILVYNFLQIVDTIGYKTFSLRAAPSDSLNYLKIEYKNFKPGIAVADSLLEWNKFQVGSIDLSKYVSTQEISDFHDYTDLIKTSNKYKSVNNVAKFFPEKIDKYYLNFNQTSVSSSVKITGYVKFSRVLIRKNFAAFLAFQAIQ